MTTAIAQPVVQKQCFRNDSPGWIGVVVIGPKGDDRGRSVAPGDLVWLTEAEQILTANAPRRADDNPFVQQQLIFGVDEDGHPIKRLVTPLTPVTENRYVPAGDRPIPAQGMQEAPAVDAAAPAVAPEPEPEPEPEIDPQAVAAREAAVVEANAAGQRPAPVVPPRAAAAVQAAAEESPPVEEHAAVERVPAEQEETGAAVPPSQDAPEGEYAAQEEVGTPTAPAAAPAPYVPPQEG